MFTATINDPLWHKSILSLALLSDYINFIITPTQLTISSLNHARTSHGEIQFDLSFFDSFALSQTHSFRLSSGQLSTIFRNVDGSVDLKASSTKLFIDINAKIIKKYQISYDVIDISVNSLDYRSKLADADLDIKFFTIDLNIMKNFVDIVPSGTQEFNIDIKQNKISFNGYTKEIVKDNTYLRQPMLLTISLAIKELVESNINDVMMSLYFKMKLFKVFINLVDVIKGETFDCYFKSDEPIMFEFHNSVVNLKFTCLSNGQGDLGIEYDTVPQPTITDTAPNESTQSESNRDNVNKPEIDQLNIDFDDFDPDLGLTQQDPIKSIFD